MFAGPQILQLVELFAPVASDRATLDRLKQFITDRGRWRKARGLFDEIRQKSLKAHRDGNRPLIAQYAFEEACAKTLYNLSHEPAPYDADAAYWIVPLAFIAAVHLNVPPDRILEIVAREPW